jgi:hypothetical protein
MSDTPTPTADALPSHEDITACAQRIAQRDAVQKEIERHEHALKQLRHRQAALDGEIAARRSALSSGRPFTVEQAPPAANAAGGIAGNVVVS